MGIRDPPTIKLVAGLADGASQIVDRFNQLTWPQLVAVIQNDPQALFHRLRNTERPPANGGHAERPTTTPPSHAATSYRMTSGQAVGHLMITDAQPRRPPKAKDLAAPTTGTPITQKLAAAADWKATAHTDAVTTHQRERADAPVPT